MVRSALIVIAALAVGASCGKNAPEQQVSSATSEQAANVSAGTASARGDGDHRRGDEGDDRDDRDDDDDDLRIKTLSNRADLISGGDALVEIVLPKPQFARALRVELNGRDIRSSFAVRASGRVIGLVTGLALGRNVLTASVGEVERDGHGEKNRSGHAAKLIITNHPIGGPVIAGPQTAPFVCATPTAQPASATSPATNASGLSTNAVDAQCNIAAEFHLFYRTTAACNLGVLPDPSNAPTPASSCFKPFDPRQPAPADLATTTTDQGVTVPYIVRVERGTIDRGIFDVAVLFTPGQDWKPWAPQAGWNGKLVYTFGASTGQPRRQFRTEQNWNDDNALSRGFMVADNSMTDSLFNSNRVYNAEALMMLKEHIVETYGEIRYTIGNGCSGGSIQQLTAASIFPGLLDGVQPTCTYPDSETTSVEVSDCVLLVNYFNSAAFANLTAGMSQADINKKKTAIAGHLDQTACWGWNNTFGTNSRPGQFVPSLVTSATGATVLLGAPRNNCQLLASQVYDPIANPTGPRCGSSDNAISIWGPAPGTTNRGRTTGDNTGVQYGLKALASGAIGAEDFVVLNETIGGFTSDSVASASRTVADPDALAIAYRSGIVSAGQLAKTPIIDIRGFDDATTNFGAGGAGLFGIHQIWRSFALRARLDQANGGHGNLVLWRFPTPLLAPPSFTLESFLAMDQWLANIEKDKSDAPREVKVVRNKPASLADFCILSTDTTFSKRITDPAVCDADPRLVKHASPRQVAGGPLAENILKCQLKAIDFTDPAYGGATFTADQQTRLKAVFPNGVCDWSKPGVNQQAFAGPLTFEEGSPGKPLGPAPRSTSF